jgi:hypothetical protein
MVKSGIRRCIAVYYTSIEYNIRRGSYIYTAAKGRYLILDEGPYFIWFYDGVGSTQTAKPALGEVIADYAIGKRYVAARINIHAAAVAAVPSVITDIAIIISSIIIKILVISISAMPLTNRIKRDIRGQLGPFHPQITLDPIEVIGWRTFTWIIIPPCRPAPVTTIICITAGDKFVTAVSAGAADHPVV